MLGLASPPHQHLRILSSSRDFSKSTRGISLQHSIQWIVREWPCAWMSLSDGSPAKISRLSMFCVMVLSSCSSSCSFLMNLWEMVGVTLTEKSSLLSLQKGSGFFLKKLMSKTASGMGRLQAASRLQMPELGLLKSGIPAETLIPAPVRNTIFLTFLYLMSSISLSFVYLLFFYSYGSPTSLCNSVFWCSSFFFGSSLLTFLNKGSSFFCFFSPISKLFSRILVSCSIDS